METPAAVPGVFVYETRAHFDELDALWVLHHSRFLLKLERAQQAFFDALMRPEAFDPQRYPDLYVVVRRVEADYLVPVKGVVPFRVLLRVERLREAALTVAWAFATPDHATVYARGRRTVCKLSLTTHAPAGWSPAFRAAFEPWAAAGQSPEARALVS